MQKRWIIPGLLAAAFAFAATGLANNGHGNGHHAKKFGPYGVVTDDHGSCANVWAADTELRTFTVKRNRDGTYFPQSPHYEKEVRAVGQHDRHMLAFRYSQRAEAIRVTVRHLMQVCIRIPGVLP